MSNSSDAAQHHVAIRDVMAQLAAELNFLVRATAAVEKVVDQIVISAPVHPPQVLRDLQNLDLLTQSLAALAIYTLELVPHCPADVHVDSGSAAHFITLAALARRLRIGGMDPHAEQYAPSDIEMFG